MLFCLQLFVLQALISRMVNAFPALLATISIRQDVYLASSVLWAKLPSPMGHSVLMTVSWVHFSLCILTSNIWWIFFFICQVENKSFLIFFFNFLLMDIILSAYIQKCFSRTEWTVWCLDQICVRNEWSVSSRMLWFFETRSLSCGMTSGYSLSKKHLI